MIEKTGKNKIKLKKEEKQYLLELKNLSLQKSKNRMAILKQNLGVRKANREAHEKMINRILKKSGVNFDELQAEIERRHKVQHKKLNKMQKKIRKTHLSQTKQQMRERRKIEIAYRKRFKEDLAKLEGNPILKFYHAVDADMRLLSTPPGSYEGSEDPQWSYSANWSINSNTDNIDPHNFYPHLYIDNGRSRDSHTLEMEQSITLSHRPLESGRGNFLVDYIKINLFGAGFHQATAVDTCPFFFNSLGTGGAAQINLDFFVFQRTPNLSWQILDNHRLWSGALGENGDFVIDLRTQRFPCSFFLASPDYGGENILVTLVLHTYVYTADDRHAIAELDLREDTFGGFELGCIDLHGEYMDG